MGVVWVVQRSLRLLTLLTLMASTLCSGQILAAQAVAGPSEFAVDSIIEPVVDIVDVRAVASAGARDGKFALAATTIVSDAPDAGADRFSPAPAAVAAAPWRIQPAPAAARDSFAGHAFTPVSGRFSPRAERAPPAASA